MQSTYKSKLYGIICIVVLLTILLVLIAVNNYSVGRDSIIHISSILANEKKALSVRESIDKSITEFTVRNSSEIVQRDLRECDEKLNELNSYSSSISKSKIYELKNIVNNISALVKKNTELRASLDSRKSNIDNIYLSILENNKFDHYKALIAFHDSLKISNDFNVKVTKTDLDNIFTRLSQNNVNEVYLNQYYDITLPYINDLSQLLTNKEKIRTLFLQFKKSYNTLSEDIYHEIESNLHSAIEIKQNNLISSIMFIILAWTITIIILVFLIRSILNPLYKLKKVIKKAQLRDFNDRFSSKYKNEISSIGTSFNSLLRSLENYQIEVEEQKKTLENAVKQRTIELEKQTELAIDSSKAKTSFLAKMSHEIRTPLNGIISTTELLSETSVDPNQKDIINIINASGKSLLNIINDILDFSKIEAGKMSLDSRPFSLKQLIHNSTNQFKQLATKKGISIDIEHKNHLYDFFKGDDHRIKQVLINLIGNAIKFTQTGQVKVITEYKVKDNIDYICFMVSDTGIGVDDEHKLRIFESFSQADNSISRKFGGTGLGISISSNIIELMNGKLKVESPNPLLENSQDKGSLFSFEIELQHLEDINILHGPEAIKISDVKLISLTDRKLLNIMSLAEMLKIENIDLPDLESLVNYQYSKSHIVLIDEHFLNKTNYDIINRIIDKTNGRVFIAVDKNFEYDDERFRLLKKLTIINFNISYSAFLNELEGIFNNKVDLTNKLKLKHLSILVAEDNKINQRVARKIFQRLGYSIDIANNGEEAVKLAKENDFNIIFMDLHMPIMDGFEATSRIRKFDTRIPIIAMTADVLESSKEKSKMISMNDYILKPISPDVISKTLKAHIDNSLLKD